MRGEEAIGLLDWNKVTIGDFQENCFHGKEQELNIRLGNSLVVQWLGLCAFTAEGAGSIPGWGTKIPQATRCAVKKKKKVRLKGRELVRKK